MSKFAVLQQPDSELVAVVEYFKGKDPDGKRTAKVLRKTFDQLYDGQHTGRYKIEQLYKTEKTHFGTLVEINLQRDFKIPDGRKLDYLVEGYEVDCKYSFSGQWMLPIESFDELVIVIQADDEKSQWSMGVIRVSEENRRSSENRDRKTSLNKDGRKRISWIHKDRPLPPNALLRLPEDVVQKIMSGRSGQQRVNELFRTVLETRITRNIVATVAQQDDYMKRVRANGGARSILAAEGKIILSGDYKNQQQIAKELGIEEPQKGELISVKVAPSSDSSGVQIQGVRWNRVPMDAEITIPAPII